MLRSIRIVIVAATVATVGNHRQGIMRSDETVWKRIERRDDVVVYVPPDHSDRSVRIEYLLSSGHAIIDDRHAGLAVRIEMRERVDWKSFMAKGAELQEEDVKQRAAAGDCFVVFRFQDSIDREGNVTQSVLRSVEEYAGRILIRQEQPDLEVDPPQHLTGTYILVREPSGE